MTLDYDKDGMPVAVSEEYARRCALLNAAALCTGLEMNWILKTSKSSLLAGQPSQSFWSTTLPLGDDYAALATGRVERMGGVLRILEYVKL